jgi:hypothetical protein
MKDYAINTSTGEFLRQNGDRYFINGDAWIAQKLAIHLQFFFGEWFLDTTQGVKWYQNILVKNPNTRDIQSILQAAIMEVPGVEAITDFNLIYDPKGRTLQLIFSVDTVNDTNLTLNLGPLP